MKSSILRVITVAAIAALLTAIFWCPEAEAASAVGKITRVKGKVAVNRGTRGLAARVGTRVMPGDLVQTRAGARVKILMSDSTVLNLGPNSRMRIRGQSRNRRTRQTASNYNLVYGRARARVPKRRAGTRRNIRFSTPTAVAGVRGTELIIEYDPVTNQTRIIAVDGTVDVVNPNNPDQVITLTPGMGTIISPGLAPTSPFNVPIEEIQRLRNQVHVQGDSPRNVIIINIPGTSGSDITGATTVEIGGGEVVIITTGTVTNPEDLVDQELPPFTTVIMDIVIPH